MSIDFEELAEQEYKYGFSTDVEQEVVPKGLNEDVIKLISSKKDEPEWLLECYTFKEASEILDIPLGTAKTRIHLGIAKLRDKLSPFIIEN